MSLRRIALTSAGRCFPVVPKLACDHLGIPCDNPRKPITLLGGLTSFGGAGANYSMHVRAEFLESVTNIEAVTDIEIRLQAVVEMTRRLRKLQNCHEASNGLVLANGGVLTTENVICLSTHPSKSYKAYPLEDKILELVAGPPLKSVVKDEAAMVEVGISGLFEWLSPLTDDIKTYTVEYDQENRLRLGHIVCRLTRNGNRVVANHADLATLNQLASWEEEPIGRSGVIQPSSDIIGQNLFSFSRDHKV